jgi:hypothetical protein
MLIKIAIIVIIAIVLRHYLIPLKSHWPVIVGLIAGTLAGWWMANFLIRFNVSFETFEFFGCPQDMVKPLFATIGALVAVKPVSIAIRQLFPYREPRDTDVR